MNINSNGTPKNEPINELLEESDTESHYYSDSQTNTDEPEVKKPHYEVVLYVRYNLNDMGRPDENDILEKFSNYGEVDHVKCPEDVDYAFIFMKRLNTIVKHRRTRTVIDKIKSDMTAEDCFYIDVARSTKYKTGPYNKFTDPSKYMMTMPDDLLAFQPGMVHPALLHYYQPRVQNRNSTAPIYRPRSQYTAQQSRGPPPNTTRSNFIPISRPVFTPVQRTLRNDKVEIPEKKKQTNISVLPPKKL